MCQNISEFTMGVFDVSPDEEYRGDTLYYFEVALAPPMSNSATPMMILHPQGQEIQASIDKECLRFAIIVWPRWDFSENFEKKSKLRKHQGLV